MSDASGPGERVRITSPHTSAPAHVRSTVGQEIDEATGVGEVYMQSLIRSQLRAALSVLATVLLTVVTLPLVFWRIEALNDAHVVGVPLPWVVLGAGVYGGMILVGSVYVRHAERAERLFTELVEPSERP